VVRKEVVSALRGAILRQASQDEFSRSFVYTRAISYTFLSVDRRAPAVRAADSTAAASAVPQEVEAAWAMAAVAHLTFASGAIRWTTALLLLQAGAAQVAAISKPSAASQEGMVAAWTANREAATVTVLVVKPVAAARRAQAVQVVPAVVTFNGSYIGSQGAGGGGGSSYVEPSAIKSRMWSAWKSNGDGLVVFSWNWSIAKRSRTPARSRRSKFLRVQSRDALRCKIDLTERLG
jgi:hypothetical protein